MNLLNVLVGPVVEAYKARQERKTQEKQVDNVLQEKKLEAMKSAKDAQTALSIAQVNSAGWKDNWFTYLFSVPLILAFFPDGRVAVMEAFHALELMPLWYKAFLGSAVASAFGLDTVDKAWTWWNS